MGASGEAANRAALGLTNGSGAFGNMEHSSRSAGGGAPRNGYHSMEEQAVVDKAIKTHQDTTASAQRAAKVAEETRDMAGNTLDALHEQGQRLDRVEGDLYEIDADVDEAKGILKYMRRCCIFFLCSCCCECDPNAERDKTRRTRVKQRQLARKMEKEQQDKINEQRRNDKEAGRGGAKDLQMTAQEARSELLKSKAAMGGATATNGNRHEIGDGLAAEDAQTMRRHTNEQDKALDTINDALGDLQRMGEAMHTEIKYQDGIIDRVDDKTSKTGTGLQNLTQTARSDHRLGPRGNRRR
eukprot:jgi/Astpho2/1913/fgenesh1_pg.00038_%23_58_t